jgi:hypothetical protein
MKRALMTSILALTLAVPASAATITFVDLGTAAPPATLGGQTMTAFPDDPTPTFTGVTSVASPLGGTVDFSATLDAREVGDGWATWSHGYTGDVYFADGLTSVTLTLPADTSAFYLYGEPNVLAEFFMSATAEDGTGSGLILVDGDSGAHGFGFYSDMTLASITVTCVAECGGFGIGEFGIAAVPEPATLLLLGTGLAFVAARARRRSRKAQA